MCPVFLFIGCGNQTPAARWEAADRRQTGFAFPGPLYDVITPDSLDTPVIWSQNYPLLISTAAITEEVDKGDTVFSGAEPFLHLERERAEMELSMAEAIGDRAAQDSLEAFLSDSSFIVFITAPASGHIRILVEQGKTVQPGDNMAVITGAPPDSVYILSPVYTHIRWPENLNGCTVTDRGLQCRGAWPGEEASLPGTWSLRQQFIHEDGLRTYVVSSMGDTLPITIIGSTDTSRIIYSVLPLDSISLLGWN